LTLPAVKAAPRYDGPPVLRMHGVFLAGLATHPSAAPNTFVVRTEIERARHNDGKNLPPSHREDTE
jgi:hypothetical protein